MKILFLTDNFPPEVNAPATRTYEHCKEWVKQGVEVTVITCAPNFPEGKVYKGYRNKFIQRETIDGIKVIRVWTFITANEGFFKRILDYLSFMISAFFAGLTIKTDIIIATSPQFFTAVAGRWLSFWKRKKWVMEVRDLWPESITAVGVTKRNIAIVFFEWLEKRMYKSASKIVVVTDSFAKTLKEKHNVNSEKIKVIKNGANLDLYKPQIKNNDLIIELGLENKFIVGYIGTHGLAHAIDFVLYAAKEIQHKDPLIHFLLIGSGAKRQELLELKKKLNLKNVTMLEAVSKQNVVQYTSIIDIGLVNLKRSETFKSVIPSKIFELAAMNKPILLGVEGESKEIIMNYNVGLSFIPEDKESFYNSICLLKEMKFDFSNLLLDFDRKKLALAMLYFVKN
jgi:glycosyltransferase involved in cell wall biosynthesis